MWGCSPTANDLLVLEAGTDKVSLREYERFYERNAGTWEAARKSSLEDREKFLDLLTNYKLKLRDAYARNLLDEPDVRSELREYRIHVARTFLLERELTGPALRAMFERRKEDLRASHILIRLNANAAPEETLKAWNRAMDIIKHIKSGTDFGTAAEQYSEDPSARESRGDLFYFTSGQMVTPFEDAAYNLKIGEVTERPLRSVFGYHIVKLFDRRPAIYSVSISHIMIGTKGKSVDSLGKDVALEKIRMVQDSLKAGRDFTALARQYSEDPGSARREGNLGFFSRRRLPPDLEEPAFKLRPGEVSDIVKTRFGYHIIRCEEVKPLPAFDELRGELQRTYQQYRYDEQYRRFVDRLREKFGFKRHDAVLNELIGYIDSTKTPSDSLWAVKVPPNVRRKPIISVGKRRITADSLITFMSNLGDFRDASLKSANFPLQVDKAGDLLVLEEACVGLEDRYPEFETLMKEFQEGVVLYKAEQLEVWNRIAIDSTRLKSFFAERSGQYTYPNRVEMVEVSTEAESIAVKIRKGLQRRRNIDTVIGQIKGSKPQKKSRGLIPADTDDLTKEAWAREVGKVVGPIKFQNRFVILKVMKKDPARRKTFGEAAPEVSTAFQDSESKRLQNEWLERLRMQYPVVQHREVLRQAFAGGKPSE